MFGQLFFSQYAWGVIVYDDYFCVEHFGFSSWQMYWSSSLSTMNHFAASVDSHGTGRCQY